MYQKLAHTFTQCTYYRPLLNTIIIKLDNQDQKPAANQSVHGRILNLFRERGLSTNYGGKDEIHFGYIIQILLNTEYWLLNARVSGLIEQRTTILYYYSHSHSLDRYENVLMIRLLCQTTRLNTRQCYDQNKTWLLPFKRSTKLGPFLAQSNIEFTIMQAL